MARRPFIVLATTYAALVSRAAYAEGPPPTEAIAPTSSTAGSPPSPLSTSAGAPLSITGRYSPYEEETLANVEAELGSKVDPHPEGKTIESVDVVPLDVFEKRDPYPSAFNVFHATTKPYIIAEQVLLKVGDRYDKVLVDETARNLRDLPQLSLVIAAAFVGSAPGRVRLVVIVKDVWSLRLGFDLALTPGGLESLLIEPTETNIAGTQQTVLARFTYTPDAYSLGATYRAPRLQGRWLGFGADANVVINIHTGQPEGSFGSTIVQRPLYSSLTNWAWATGVVWSDTIARRYENAHLASYAATVGGATVNVPWEYRARLITEDAYVTRSFGWANKSDFTWGAEINRHAYETPALGVDAAAVAQFVHAAIPVSDTRVGPFAQWRGYTTNFLRILDFETLGLQEDYRLGHDVWLRAYPVPSALGASRTFLGVYAAAQYTVKIGDGLARGSVESTTEAEPDRLTDAALGANARFVSPRFAVGRVVFDVAFLNRYRNYLNQMTFLGGDSRLRGYPSSFFAGKDFLVANLELRSRPVQILATELGGVLFADAGDAMNGLDNFVLHRSVGVGLRVLFPQFERICFRADYGVALEQPIASSFFVTFGTAFPVESVGGVNATGGTSATAPLNSTSTSGFNGFLGQ